MYMNLESMVKVKDASIRFMTQNAKASLIL